MTLVAAQYPISLAVLSCQHLFFLKLVTKLQWFSRCFILGLSFYSCILVLVGKGDLFKTFVKGVKLSLFFQSTNFIGHLNNQNSSFVAFSFSELHTF